MRKLIICLFILVNINIYAKQQTSDHFFDSAFNTVSYNIFNEGFYDHYHSQLLTFVDNYLANHRIIVKGIRSPRPKTKFQLKVINLIHLIKTPLPQESVEKGKFHQTFVQHFREILQLKNTINSSVTFTLSLKEFIEDLTFWIYTKPNLIHLAESYLLREASLTKEEIINSYHSSPETFFLHLFESFKDIPRFQTYTEKLPIHDPIYFGDVPCQLYNLNNKKQTLVIRMANPVKDISVDLDACTITPQLTEEFISYLECLRAQEKKQLYINVMGKGCEENPRATLVENLEFDPNFKNNIIVVSLDKNKASSFYFQKDEYEFIESASLFKAIFINKLFDPSSYYWSQAIKVESWKLECRAIIEHVHKTFFNNSEKLTLQERLDFIELVYLKIIDTLIEKFNPDILNLTCKQTVDRGPSLYTLLYIHDCMKRNISLEGKEMDIFNLYFAPPYAFHNRLAHSYRVSRLQGAFNLLIKNQKNH